MTRMKFHHHKYALTLTVAVVAIIGVILGVQVDKAVGTHDPLLILTFSLLLVLLVLNFILTSVLLRTREELFELHSEYKNLLKKPRKTKKK